MFRDYILTKDSHVELSLQLLDYYTVSGFVELFCCDYLVSLYDSIVSFMRRRLPVQMDGVVLLMAHCYGHSHWRRTRNCIKIVFYYLLNMAEL